MDIHRARFVPYPPAAINCLAFSHRFEDTTQKAHPATRLAVGRANGSIEIWNPSGGNWVQETIFHGGKDRSIEGLAWTEEPDLEASVNRTNGEPTPTTNKRKQIVKPRLFSVGYSSAVTEWDLATGVPLRNSAVHHSEAWCIAAQPSAWSQRKRAGSKQSKKDKNSNPVAGGEESGQSDETEPESQHLAVGHADGTITLLSTADDDLSFVRIVGRPTKRKARVLSIAFQSKNIIVAGYSDSAIRVYDISTSTLIRTINFGASSTGTKDLLVWTVACLPNGNIVSGDSSGEIRIWNGTKFFQMQVLVGHHADVLGVTVSADGNTIVSTGMDRRVTVYEAESTSRGHRFFESSHSRHHDHDVKAIATLESRALSVFVTGGLDTKLVISPLRNRSKEVHFTQPGLPQVSPLVSAPKKRMVCSWWNREISIWLISNHGDLLNGTDYPYHLLSKFHLSGDENITDVAITQDGRLLAVATKACVRLFQLTLSFSKNVLDPYVTDSAVSVKKLAVPAELSNLGGRLVRFSPDGQWLALVRSDSTVILSRFVSDGSSLRAVDTVVPLPRLSRNMNVQSVGRAETHSLGRYLRTITRAEFSPDNRALVATDLGGWMDSWVLDGTQDGSATEVVRKARKAGISKMRQNSSDSESESDNDDDDDDADILIEEGSAPWRSQVTILGQTWIQNANGRMLPKLNSGAILLSFRPAPASQPDRRHLMVVTMKHHLFELDVGIGTTTEWTRRNNYVNIPEQFQTVRARAIGCLWQLDSLPSNDDDDGDDGMALDKSVTPVTRFWIWGHSWLFMFNLDKDFPVSADRAAAAAASQLKSQKRRLGGGAAITDAVSTAPDSVVSTTTTPTAASSILEGIKKFSKHDTEAKQVRASGAGDAVKPDQVVGFDTEHIVALASPDMMDIDSPVSQQPKVKKQLTPATPTTPTTTTVETFSKDEVRKQPQLWRTFKYRPILGIVPIEKTASPMALANNDPARPTGGDGPLEVVLVERPEWDLDLPDRLMGVHERH